MGDCGNGTDNKSTKDHKESLNRLPLKVVVEATVRDRVTGLPKTTYILDGEEETVIQHDN